MQQLKQIYWGMVTYIDDQIGGLLDFLERKGLTKNSIVVFTSDHGDYMGDHSMIRKGVQLYDCLTHVPLIIRWAGHIQPRTSDALSSNIDVFPTLLDLIHIPVPEAVQGKSFTDILYGRSDEHREMVFMEHGVAGKPLNPGDLTLEQEERLQMDHHHHMCPEIMRGKIKGVRTKKWKYMMNYGDTDELYDLENDPNEHFNLSGEADNQEVERFFRDAILNWLIETEGIYPLPKKV